MKYLLISILLWGWNTPDVWSQKLWHVYVFIGEECPVCNYMGKPLKAIADKYQERVEFHAVFPLRNSTGSSADAFKFQYGLDAFQTLLDRDLAITRELGATVTPEAVITDDQGRVYYRGRINSAYYAPGKMKHGNIKNDLDLALEMLLGGENIAPPWPTPIGCYITMNAPR